MEAMSCVTDRSKPHSKSAHSIFQMTAEADTLQDDAGAVPAPRNMFDAARAKRKRAVAPTGDELEHYLAIEPDATIDNALAWWASPERHAMYPTLSRMACSYLTIPREPVYCYVMHA